MSRTWLATLAVVGLTFVGLSCSYGSCASVEASSASAAARAFVRAVADDALTVADDALTCGYTAKGTEFSASRIEEIREAVDHVADIGKLQFEESSEFADTAIVHVLTPNLEDVVALHATSPDGDKWFLTGDLFTAVSPDPTSKASNPHRRGPTPT